MDYLLQPTDVSGVRITIEELRNHDIPYRVIGGGSNVILPDQGYHGALISLARLSSVAICGETVTADAGVKMPFLARRVADASLSGLEFACGIPGEVGGAICANAGAYGQMVSDVLISVVLMNPDGELEMLSAEELEMGYHRCQIPQHSVILSAVFRLVTEDRETIEDRMRYMRERRETSQPRERSAGSVFRRVGETPAAIYIEKTGLKGLRIGGAELSSRHCNFIVNKGGATTEEYFAVAERVRERVLEQSNVLLEYEVERICSPRRN